MFSKWRQLFSRSLTFAMFCICMVMLGSCSTRRSVLQPKFKDGGLLAQAIAVPERSLIDIGGIFSDPEGSDILGRNPLVLHATRRHVSIFAQSNAAYVIMRAGCLEAGTQLVLEGWWRYANAEDAGLIRVFVEPAELARTLCTGGTVSDALRTQATLRGTLGFGDADPTEVFSSKRTSALQGTHGFVIAAHHGACRTIDDCGVSENSLESIRMVEPYGASVVELDVRLSRDGIPILYHDETLSPRLSRGPFCHGSVEDFTLDALRSACVLKYGEAIPSLDEALETIVRDTELTGVWLDVKVPEAMAPTLAVMRKYKALATQLGRSVEIVVGLADADAIAAYRASPPMDMTCLCELNPEDVRAVPCAYWGPRWTQGPMTEDVHAMQKEGRRVVYWTINEVEFLNLFLKTRANGILTDRTGLLFNKIQLLELSGQPVGPAP